MVALADKTSLVAENTPGELRARRQWVCWRDEPLRDGKRTKVPYDAKTGLHAKSTDPATWATFEQAMQQYAASERYNGIGFVFSPDDPYAGIDLDDCLDEAGNLAAWAQPIVAAFPSYTEISPSGQGLKIFLRGGKPDYAQCSAKSMDPAGGPGETEIYDRARYFTVTGNVYPGSARNVTDCQAALDALCERFWRRQETPAPGPSPAIDTQRGERAVEANLPQQEAAYAEQSTAHRDDRVGQCLTAMLNMKVTDKTDGSHRLFAAACRCVAFDLSDAEAIVAVRCYAAVRPFPTRWSNADILKRVRDAEDRVKRGESLDGEGEIIVPAFKTVGELLVEYPELREPVIDGLLREGETMNVIAASKTGKSWLVTDLALAVATGRRWLGLYETTPGRVLVLDNELHSESSASRIPKVAEARGIPLADIANCVCVDNMRGRLVDLLRLESYFNAIEPGAFKIVVLDAWYRFIPPDCDENGNGQVAALYNAIDRYADHLKASFILIHHTTKGSQSAKSVVDVGAGAGSQSRATDTHLILRHHQQENVVVLDAAVRSWKPIDPMCLEWRFPVWNPTVGLDPTNLRQDRQRRRRQTPDEPPKPSEPEWDSARFTSTFVSEQARTKAAIIEAAEKAGLSERRAGILLKRAVEGKQAFTWRSSTNNEPTRYATVQPPLIDVGPV